MATTESQDPEPVRCQLYPECDRAAAYAVDVAIADEDTSEEPACEPCAIGAVQRWATIDGGDVRDLGPAERYQERELMTDGGRPEGVTEHPEGFHSGTHYLDEPEPGPDPADPSNWCYECGDEARHARCVCGMPLCHRHHETQAGFCSDHTHIRTRVGQVPACIRPAQDGLEVVVDAPAVNYQRPARQRLPPSELEQAVRSRLPDALLVRAQEHLEDALELDDTEFPDKDDCQKVLHADDALAFTLAADYSERRDEWLRVAYRCIDDVRASLSTDEWGLAMDLRLAAGLLEQLGADRGGEET